MSNLAPGVYVQEQPFLANPGTTSAPTGSVAVFVGAHTQGPLTATPVQTWSQFQSIYGGFTGQTIPSNLALAVFVFFQNGGPGCTVLRVAHEDAVSASVTLNGASATPTLTVTALNPGLWGNNITVVPALAADDVHFSLTVNFTNASGQTQLAEPVWANLSMSPGDLRYAPAVLNSPIGGSAYINVADLAASPGVTAGPPPIAGTFPLTAGTNGSTVTTGDLAGTTAALNVVKAPMLLNVPGESDVANVLSALATYCQTGRSFADSILYVDPPAGNSVAAEEAFAGTLPDVSYVTTYYPWVTVPDPANNSASILRTIAPGAFAIAIALSTDVSRGVQKAPAGAAAILNAVGLELDLGESDIGNLTAAGVNCIRPLPSSTGTNIVIWGARTMAPAGSLTLYLNVRRVLIYVEANLKQLTTFAMFEDNGSSLWQQVAFAANGFLSSFWAGGGLANATAAQSFYVICDNTINTVPSNTVNLQVGIAPAEPAEFVAISVSQFSGASAASTVTDNAA